MLPSPLRRPLLWTRRDFLTYVGVAAAAGTGWLHPLGASARTLPCAGRPSELFATDPGGLDLVLERQPLLVAGRPGEAITLNGSIPGPVIRLREGEEARIRVHNWMDASTSIHWHGVLLPFTMDGVPGISFDGIAPGETFTYDGLAVSGRRSWRCSPRCCSPAPSAPRTTRLGPPRPTGRRTRNPRNDMTAIPARSRPRPLRFPKA